MQLQSNNPSSLWAYADIADYLKVSVHKLRHDVMNRKFPFIKIGRSVRFDKKQIDKFLNIESDDTESTETGPIPVKKVLKDTAAWLSEQSARYPYADIGIKVVIHDGQIRHIERTVTEKIRDK